MPALAAASSPTAATGTPEGICTIENSESCPASWGVKIGSPITGRVVWAASTPGRAAALPAAAMITWSPRSTALDPYSATRRGSRWALSTSSSYSTPNFSSMTAAVLAFSSSEVEPSTIPTLGGIEGSLVPVWSGAF